jgi:DNA (cytosine-5)-methyltransferase 1
VTEPAAHIGSYVKPRLLDLFCGAGGAAMGYHRAGFEVVGVDITPQPRYPFEFHQGDAMTWPLDGYDAIHASPPCKRFTDLAHMWNRLEHPDLLTPTRERLTANGHPWVIENVEGAPMSNFITLCGSAFGLTTTRAELRRHRRFESSIEWPVFIPACAHGARSRVIGVYGGHGRDRRRRVNGQDFPTTDRRSAMGIDWMTGEELNQAIPPAYTEWIGAQLLAELGSVDLTRKADSGPERKLWA